MTNLRPDIRLMYSVAERVNVHAKSGTEWALNVQWVRDHAGMPPRPWTIVTWDRKPEEEEVERAMDSVHQAVCFTVHHLDRDISALLNFTMEIEETP